MAPGPSTAAMRRYSDWRRQLQMDQETDEVVGKRLGMLRTQTPRAAKKAQQKSSASEQPSDGKEPARPSLWDSRRWGARVR